MKALKILLLISGLVIFTSAQNATLAGRVYDANGAVIVKAKIVAVNKKGERFEATTNNEGRYFLSLPFNQYDRVKAVNFKIAKYDLEVDGTQIGFEKFVLKDFKFVSSSEWQMNLDFALDAVNPEPCGYAGADCLQPTKMLTTPVTKVSKRVIIKPLVNKGKNKKGKNNKQ